MKLTILAWYVSGWWELKETTTLNSSILQELNSRTFGGFCVVLKDNTGFFYSFNSNYNTTLYYCDFATSSFTLLENRFGEAFYFFCAYLENSSQKLFLGNGDSAFYSLQDNTHLNWNGPIINNNFPSNRGSLSFNIPSIANKQISDNKILVACTFWIRSGEQHCVLSVGYIDSTSLSQVNLYKQFTFSINSSASWNAVYILTEYVFIIIGYTGSGLGLINFDNSYSQINILKPISFSNSDINTRIHDLKVTSANNYQTDECYVIITEYNSKDEEQYISFYYFPNGLYNENYDLKSYETNPSEFDVILNKISSLSLTRSENIYFYCNNNFSQLIVFIGNSYYFEQLLYFRKTAYGNWKEVSATEANPDNRITNYANGNNMFYSFNTNTALNNVYNFSFRENRTSDTLYSYDLTWND